MEKNSNYSLYGRKASMTSTTKLAAFSVLATLPGINIAQSSGVLMVALTVQQVRDIIFKEISNAPFLKAVDQLHLGSLDQEVTGIVTTMFPTFRSD